MNRSLTLRNVSAVTVSLAAAALLLAALARDAFSQGDQGKRRRARPEFEESQRLAEQRIDCELIQSVQLEFCNVGIHNDQVIIVLRNLSDGLPRHVVLEIDQFPGEIHDLLSAGSGTSDGPAWVFNSGFPMGGSLSGENVGGLTAFDELSGSDLSLEFNPENAQGGDVELSYCAGIEGTLVFSELELTGFWTWLKCRLACIWHTWPLTPRRRACDRLCDLLFGREGILSDAAPTIGPAEVEMPSHRNNAGQQETVPVGAFPPPTEVVSLLSIQDEYFRVGADQFAVVEVAGSSEVLARLTFRIDRHTGAFVALEAGLAPGSKSVARVLVDQVNAESASNLLVQAFNDVEAPIVRSWATESGAAALAQ